MLALLIIAAIIIFIIVKANTEDNNLLEPRAADFRDLLLALVAVSAGYSGGAVLYYLPPAVFGNEADNAVFAGRLVLGVLLLILGLLLKKVTGIFLMIMGIFGLLLAAPFVFNNLGSAGALVAVVIAFAVLVFFTVRFNKKNQHHG
jgi:hypothetical protein